MPHQAGLGSRTELRSPPNASLINCEFLPETSRPRDRDARPGLSTDELAFKTFAAFRAHPHISNVLTHNSGANWVRVERSLNRFLDLATASDGLSPLEQNIIDLTCADRGITSRIMKPYFHTVLHKILQLDHAERLIRHVETLFLELEWKAQHPAHAAPVQNKPSLESGHARSEPQ
ncbi:MAG: hypothetical protein K2X57_13815 [Xanthobacteraceae bacterium]|nr:hypothetical protein [Xanthobacteraceae bacterium]